MINRPFSSRQSPTTYNYFPHVAVLFFLFVLVCTGLSQANFNISELSVVNPDGTENDVWGYVDDNGVEYAIIGSTSYTYIYSLEDPSNPVLRAGIGGASGTWRDMKSFGDFVYAVADQGADGLLIVDMSNAPTTITHEFWTPSLTIGSTTKVLNRCHNLYVDEDGYGYLSGCDISSKGVIIIDLFTTPGTPQYVGNADLEYSHDVYVRDSMMYTSEIYKGEFAVYDVSDRSNPVLLASEPTGYDFTHNAWLSDNGDYIFTTDERNNAFVEAYDISDLNNISRLDRFKPLSTVGSNLIPHNVHVIDDYLVISYYTYGVVIVDANQPDNLIEVGHFDTHGGSGGGFGGCWGAYPFLPSGILLASDRGTGLRVLDPTYERACYLRGTVRDSATLNPIIGANIEIVSPNLNEASTDNFGRYASGIRDAGTYDVIVSHPAYTPDTISVVFANGISDTLDVYLDVYPPPCTETLYLTGNIKSDQYFAKQILADGILSMGTEAVFYADSFTRLDPGFEAEIGSTMWVSDRGCD